MNFVNTFLVETNGNVEAVGTDKIFPYTTSNTVHKVGRTKIGTSVLCATVVIMEYTRIFRTVSLG